MLRKENKGYAREVKWANVLRNSVGRDGLRLRQRDVMTIHRVPKRFTAYWTEKARNPAFHAGELGGARHFLLSNDEQRAAEILLWQSIVADSMQPMTQLARGLRAAGYLVDRGFD